MNRLLLFLGSLLVCFFLSLVEANRVVQAAPFSQNAVIPLTKSASASVVNSGNVVTYTIQLTNTTSGISPL